MLLPIPKNKEEIVMDHFPFNLSDTLDKKFENQVLTLVRKTDYRGNTLESVMEEYKDRLYQERDKLFEHYPDADEIRNKRKNERRVSGGGAAFAFYSSYMLMTYGHGISGIISGLVGISLSIIAFDSNKYLLKFRRNKWEERINQTVEDYYNKVYQKVEKMVQEREVYRKRRAKCSNLIQIDFRAGKIL